MSKQKNDYNAIRDQVRKTYSQRSNHFHATEALRIYNLVKTNKEPSVRKAAFDEQMSQLKQIMIKKKSENMLLFIKAVETNKKNVTGTPSTVSNASSSNSQAAETIHAVDNEVNSDVETPNENDNRAEKRKPTRAQDEAKSVLNQTAERVAQLSKLLSAGLLADKRELEKANAAHFAAQKKLKQIEANAERQRRFQLKRRDAIRCLAEENSDIAKKLRVHDNPGHPSVTETQHGLLDAIKEIAMRGAGANDRRRTEVLNSCRTLDDLADKLKGMGFILSRSALYIRLSPKSWNTLEGKRHVETVPVRLRRPQNNEHRAHPDTAFAKASVDCLKELCSALGPFDVAVLSQDDKAKVPIGLPAAKKQSHLVMSMEYEIRLPDHDFVIANNHKLIPSVVAGLVVRENDFNNGVSYSGPTYIGIRSSKHDASVATTHSLDIRHIYEDIEEFHSLLYRPDGSKKPVLVLFVDGGPDENPRYQKTISSAVDQFRYLDLDALYIVTQAPGRSAYNQVERRMAPLSQHLAGVILPHNHFGSHLDSQGRTVDTILEKKNFENAGKVLAEIWSGNLINGYPVVADWRGGKDMAEPATPSSDWLVKHVRASQYCLQIRKCDNRTCCTPMRSSLQEILPDGFIPAPVPVTNASGLNVTNGPIKKFLPLFMRIAFRGEVENAPYDKYCPSVKDDVKKRTCDTCGIYFPSVVMLHSHQRDSHRTKPTEAVQYKVIRHFKIPTYFLLRFLLIMLFMQVRPIRIAARRQRELMILMNKEDSEEWMDEEFVDCRDITIPKNDTNPAVPILSDDPNPWEML